MLDVTPICSAKEATKYYASTQTSDNYYLDELGHWWGKGAILLGLEGRVRREDFQSLSANKVPGMDTKLTVRTKKKRTSGYDFCFNVPKSLSVYLAETGDRVAERMILESCHSTLSAIEQEMRTRVNGERDRVTGNIICAYFVHRVTRPTEGIPDPHYHIHAYVFNATHDQVENRWKAGQFINVVSRAPEYQSHFNQLLMDKLSGIGYRIRKTKDAFELSTVSRELIEKFSNRQKSIMAAVGHMSAKVRNWFAIAYREPKTNIKLDEKQQLTNWRSRMTQSERIDLSIARQETAPKKTLFQFGIHQTMEREQERTFER